MQTEIMAKADSVVVFFFLQSSAISFSFSVKSWK